MSELNGGAVHLTLIVPAYNESAIILRTIEELKVYMTNEMPDRSFEILVVDDGSTDGMDQIVADVVRDEPVVRLVRHRGNRGRGRAIRTGFDHARGAYVICLDADLSYAPEHIHALLKPLEEDEADITMASAYHPDGEVSNVPFTRALMSRWGNRVLSTGLYGRFYTLTCIVRGYNRDALEQLELINDGKDLHLEVIQKAMLFGLRIKEIPAHLKWRDRDRGNDKKGILGRIPFLSMSSTIASHLVYNYVLRPGSILMLPVAALMLAVFVGVLTLLGAWFAKLMSGPESFGLAKLYLTLRETLIQGNLTLLVIVAGSVVSLIFVAFYFASQQNKKNFEELYILVSRMNTRMKRLEKRIER